MLQVKRTFKTMLPVVIDCEMSGVDPGQHALLEIAAFPVHGIEGCYQAQDPFHAHVLPFEGAKMDDQALKINGIDPFYPLRFAISEALMLERFAVFLRQHLQQVGCQKALLVGHNVHFDLAFLLAAQKRQKRTLPHHHFCVFDTVTLGLYMLGEHVLARAMRRLKLPFDVNQAHGALYDAERTAALFCHFMNHRPRFEKGANCE